MALVPFIKPEQRWIQENGKPVQPLGAYFSSLDRSVRSLVSGGIVSPFDFNARGDGVTDDFLPVSAALATGLHVDLRNGVFACSQPLAMQNFQWMYHGKIIKTFNGDLLDMTAQQCALDHIEIDGNGMNGRGVVINLFGAPGDLSRQLMHRTFIGNCVGYALELTAPDCGALFHADDCAFGRTVSANEAVKLPIDTLGLFTGRSFVNCSQGGNAFIDLGGSRSTRIIGGNSTKITWTANTLYCHVFDHRCAFIGTVDGQASQIRGCNIGNTFTIKGTQHVIENNTHQGNALILDAAATACSIYPNDAAFTDNAGVASNKIFGLASTFTPLWTSTGVQPALGGGGDSLTGSGSRNGYDVTLQMVLTISAATVVGTGVWIFQAPLPFGMPPAANAIFEGHATYHDASTGNVYQGVVFMAGTSLLTIYNAGGTATGWGGTAPPVAPAAGDFLVLNLKYQCGA